uniref:Transferred entry: 7.1.2.2 n=1 Tax=Heterorhabditis bacteriophora TaxID=37862 RepID=A0A1I7XE61_HETBA
MRAVRQRSFQRSRLQAQLSMITAILQALSPKRKQTVVAASDARTTVFVRYDQLQTDALNILMEVETEVTFLTTR